MNKNFIFLRIIRFYFEGFKNMNKWGKQVWLIILIKLFILFIILKIFFFPNFLKQNFETDEQRSQYILESLTESKQ